MPATTVEDIRQCQSEKSSVLRLELSARTNCEEIAGAISEITTATTEIPCCISRVILVSSQRQNGDEPNWESDGIVMLFETLGKLPNLSSMTLKGRGSMDNHFPLYLLRSILIPSRHRLRYLHVNFMQLQLGTYTNPQGTTTTATTRRSVTSDLHLLEQALTQMTLLRHISFHYLAIFEDHHRTSSGFEQYLLGTLGKIPSLQQLEVVGKSEAQAVDFFGHPVESDSPRWDRNGQDLICQSNTTIQDIRVESMDLTFRCVRCIFESLLLQHNNNSSSRLKKLMLGTLPFDISGSSAAIKITNKLHQTIRDLLSSHRTLEELCLYGYDGGGGYDGLLCSIAQGLKSNNVLDNFQFHSSCMDISDSVEQEFGTALQSNLTLRRLVLGTPSNANALPKVDYYLKLNNLNRKHFVENYETITHQEWIQILAIASPDSLDTVYYFLRLNPYLCVNNA